VAGAVKLLGRRQAGGARTYYRHLLAGAVVGRLGLYPALLVAAIGNLLLDILNGHRIGIYAQDAGRLAGGGADAAGKFRKVIGAEQHFQGPLPIPHVDLVVKLGNDVAQGAAHVAERNGAVHAPGTLFPGIGVGPVQVEFLIVALTFCYRAAIWRPAPEFHESGRFTHFELLPAFYSANAFRVLLPHKDYRGLNQANNSDKGNSHPSTTSPPESVSSSVKISMSCLER